MGTVVVCQHCQLQISIDGDRLPDHMHRNTQTQCNGSGTQMYVVLVDSAEGDTPPAQPTVGIYRGLQGDLPGDLLTARAAAVDMIIEYAAMQWGACVDRHPLVVQIDRILRRCGHAPDDAQDCA